MNDRAAAKQSWQLTYDAENIAWLEFDKPDASANTLSRAAIAELDSRIAELEQRKPSAAIVVSAKSSGFIAGADVKEFTSVKSPEEALSLVRNGQRVFDRISALPFPTVAAVHGFALGGGLELALACRYRIAADDGNVKLGFPEVQLGIHPAWGGTVRSVRLIGPIAALELMVSGRNVRAHEALKAGLVDRLAPLADLRAAAKHLALESPPPRQLGITKSLLNLKPLRSFVAKAVTRQVSKRARRDHYPAPYAIVDLWQRHGADPKKGYEAEALSFAALLETPACRNLVRVFLLQDRLKNLGTRSNFKASHVHVVGAGIMGGDIATWCAARGLQVSLQDRGMEYIKPALDRAQKYFARRLHSDEEKTQALARITPDVEGKEVPKADVVIEAIFENAQAKRDLYSRIEPNLRETALLGTNTSSIVLEELNRDLKDPGRLVGVHFFNPVAQMPLIEVVASEDTHREVTERAMAFIRQLDKLPLPCRSAPGFVVNRILMPYLTEAMLAADEGVPLAVIDQAATDFGMPMGPIELADVVGLDIALHVGGILAKAFGGPSVATIQHLVAEKKLGRKTGQGFYLWRDGKPVKPPAPDATVPPDLTDRMILLMLNESVAVLREQVLDDADLIDAGVIFGTGFAPFRGGPLQYARSRGIANVVARLEELARTYGEHFNPDAGWQLLQ